jgi:DNA-binding LytR/AlgR family response regulator
MQNYVRIYLADQTLTAYATLKSIQEELPVGLFVQPYLSYLGNIDKVRAIEGNRLIAGSHKIPISKYKKEEVMGRIVGEKLFER